MAQSFENFVTNYKKNGFLHLPADKQKTMLLHLYNGDYQMFEKMDIPLAQSGILSEDQLRQARLIAICTCSVGSNFAVLRDVDAEMSLSLSDYYIQLIQKMDDVEKLSDLTRKICIHFSRLISDQINTNYPDAVQKPIQYINDHLYFSFTVEDVAQYANMNADHLAKLFKNEMGISIKDFIHRSKLREAKNLMLYTDMSFTEIAVHLGYADLSHFTKNCKKYEGATPSQLKKKWKKDPIQ